MENCFFFILILKLNIQISYMLFYENHKVDEYIPIMLLPLNNE